MPFLVQRARNTELRLLLLPHTAARESTRILSLPDGEGRKAFADEALACPNATLT